MKNPVLILIVGACLGAIGMSGVGQPEVAQAFGAFPSHGTEESYFISVGATAGGNEARDQLKEEFRKTVVVPDHYGDVVAVTSAPSAAILWYRDTGGVVRNVILYEPEARLFRLEQRTTARREVRLHR